MCYLSELTEAQMLWEQMLTIEDLPQEKKLTFVYLIPAEMMNPIHFRFSTQPDFFSISRIVHAHMCFLQLFGKKSTQGVHGEPFYH